MAQAARPLPSDEPRPRPQLRAVPPPPRRRPPSRAVIRRRRIVALGGLGALIALPLAVLATGGGPSSDSARIEALLATGASEPRTLCDHLSGGMLTAIGGTDACLAASPERGPAATVSKIRIDGTVATAVVSSDNGTERVKLVREDGDWKVDDVR
jgi:hypothetical protein